MSNLYFDESLAGDDLAPGALVVLSGDEARHAVTVSRLRVGESILVGNGAGVRAECSVRTATPRSLELVVTAVETRPVVTPGVVLVQALAKGDRDERAVEAVTEMGIDAVIPWQAERSVSRWTSDKLLKGTARWSKVAREAAKQSLRFRLPVVRPLVDITGLVALAANNRVLVLDPEADQRLSRLGIEWLTPLVGGEIVIVVGPEGGLSPRELEMLASAGAVRVALGETVLRTSTAGPAALALVNAALNRW
ncbi:16S rRNA (uracil(1498)-N(3))-methyltransferase [Klugiella xanthotipulae]|uniref:Ribosomal RNA small subunit methyltransferase E n=1 Tax=Klugiella xanthotipulae TaxID=244735 RepID=A0A543HSE5_9MICO|nr:16S rRNA (uracil(1498)-N(3))-methyltransferase [Klugiella xanthotipulae]TQM61261.1 16S rRNA (uracil1498-N3)-methyltransferase [Klugiella xanthotipulae]